LGWFFHGGKFSPLSKYAKTTRLKETENKIRKLESQLQELQPGAPVTSHEGDKQTRAKDAASQAVS